MKNTNVFSTRPLVAASLALCALLAAPAHAVTYTLIAEAIPETAPAAVMPNGAVAVPMWGYRVSAPGGDEASANAAALTSPGAALVVPPGDAVLSVTLVNRLAVPTSFVVHGLNTAMAPVFTDAAGAACSPDAVAAAADAVRRACRLRSFTSEVAAVPVGGPAPAPVIYTYNNVRPGTYLYQSGTLPQIQVQMGLYGMMSKDDAAGVAYPGVAYINQTRVIFSEVDPTMHAAVTAGTFTGSTLDYDPKHFRTHVYDAVTHLPVQAGVASAPQFMGATHLVRMANAGLQSRVPTLSDGTWFLLGEDAQPYPYAREQYTALLPAAKTTDAWLNAPRALTLFDRRMAFADAATGVAGQYLKFTATASPTTSTQLTANCPTIGTQGVLWTCTVSTTTPGATLSLVSAPAGMVLQGGAAATTRTLRWLNPTNAQAQRPAAQSILNSVAVAATSAAGGTTTNLFTVAVANVNDAPTAGNKAYNSDLTQAGRVTVLPTNGLKIGAADIDGDPLAVASITGLGGAALAATDSVTINAADGSFVFTTTDIPAAGGVNRVVPLQYTLTDVPDPLNKGALPALTSVARNLNLTIRPNVRPVRTATSTTFGSNASPNVVQYLPLPISTYSTPDLTSATYVADNDGSVNACQHALVSGQPCNDRPRHRASSRRNASRRLALRSPATAPSAPAAVRSSSRRHEYPTRRVRRCPFAAPPTTRSATI